MKEQKETCNIFSQSHFWDMANFMKSWNPKKTEKKKVPTPYETGGCTIGLHRLPNAWNEWQIVRKKLVAVGGTSSSKPEFYKSKLLFSEFVKH